MEYSVSVDTPFSLDYTLASGQAFRWEKKGSWWYGVVAGGVLKVSQEGEVLKCSASAASLDTSFVRRYFRLDEDIEPIMASIAKDPVMSQAVERFYGLRVLRQEKWECLASFLLATNSNIPRIGQMILSLCSRYGERISFEGVDRYTFPAPENLASASAEDLRRCGLGYRAPFVRHVAGSVASGRVDLARISELAYEKARDALISELLGQKALLGVGPKVADCALLYSFEKAEAFPIDVWIARALLEHYPRLVPRAAKQRLRSGSPKLSRGDYFDLSKAARRYFGPQAGYAQLYLYNLARADQSTD